MLAALKPGSVIVDLAAENGGNCVATVPGQLIVHNGVTIIGLSNLCRSPGVSNDIS
jgi:NAD(P) transhydrogenase